MPFGNYSELQSTIQDYLEQEEVTGKIPDFITLAEARVNREISVRWMHKTATGYIDTDVVPLPLDYIESVAWWVTTSSQPFEPEYVPPRRFFGMSASAISGTPRVYTIVGLNSLWRPNPTGVTAGTHGYTLEYLAEVPALSNNNTTNWLLTKAPDVYLYASLLEAMPYVIDTENMATWVKMYERSIKSLVSSDARGRHRPGGVMRPRKGPRDSRFQGQY